MAALAGERGVAFVDIVPASRRAAADPSLVARDGPAPSAAQYELWVDEIEPVVRALLRARSGLSELGFGAWPNDRLPMESRPRR
jgi:hypothetical protein